MRFWMDESDAATQADIDAYDDARQDAKFDAEHAAWLDAQPLEGEPDDTEPDYV